MYAAGGRRRLAIKYFGKAIELGEGRPRYYLDRARACEEEGDLSCAAWDYFVAAASPDIASSASFYHLLASAMYRIGEYGEALEAADKALKKEPANPDTYLLRGRVLADSGKPAAAAAAFRKAASLSPSRKEEAELLLRKLSDRALR